MTHFDFFQEHLTRANAMKSLLLQSRTAVRLFTVVLCCMGAAAAHAQSMFFSGPSVARANSAATFQGGNFKANMPVTVVVVAPNGTESSYGAVAGADGKLSYELTPGQVGAYRIAVTSIAGKVLLKTTLIANP